ncbi:MAG: carboxypeptidase-like regulatory domain-containing protein [Flavobacteriia bacterium]|nr:carboxypeptidase-like regulatory domain-containing protein [Flavobacteriia bacterium]
MRSSCLKKIFFSCFLLSNIIVKAQNKDSILIDTNKLIQLSGVVVSENELEQLSYTTVYDKTLKRGVLSDYYGYFTLVTYPGDTLIFSFYGYKKSSFIVPDTLKDNRYSIIHMLQKDTINLPQVDIYPWPSRDDFARYFVNMKPYDDAFRKAQKVLSGESLAFAAAKLDNDASLASGYAANQYYTKIYSNGQLPANNLLNPYAWSKFIQEWKKGSLKRE